MSASITAGESRDNGLQATWNRLRANPKIPLLVAASAAIAIVVALLLWVKSPDYRVLYSNLNDRDGGAIVTQLTQMNIPYRFAENGAALLIPAELFKGAYRRMGLDNKNLSRTVEDAGTVIEPLIPWTAAGIYMATTLGVSTLDLLPWAIQCYAAVVFALIYGFTGFGIAKLQPQNDLQRKEA